MFLISTLLAFALSLARAESPVLPVLPAVDLAAPVRTITFDPAQLNRLTFGDRPMDILRLVPGVRLSRGGSLGGTPLSESAVMLDGVVVMRDGFLSP